MAKIYGTSGADTLTGGNDDDDSDDSLPKKKNNNGRNDGWVVGRSIPPEILQNLLFGRSSGHCSTIGPKSVNEDVPKNQNSLDLPVLLLVVSAERHRCQRRGMARAVVVVERTTVKYSTQTKTATTTT